MALWGTSRASDLQHRIDEMQQGLASLSEMVGSSATRAGKQARSGAHQAQAAVSEGTGDVASSIVPVLSDLGKQIEALLSVVTAITGGFARKAGKESRQAYTAVEETVENHAMLAVLAAAGVGFLLGAAVVGGAAAARSAQQPQVTGRRPTSRVD
jgi:ElaB/YqjD/DUF883 family membrane-anchored ribosome-binding protein